MKSKKDYIKSVFSKGFTRTPKNWVSGFTLIELLIVIAIIGLISTVVLTSLSQSQARSYDTKIVQQLTNFRTAAQIYFTNNTSYGPTSSDCASGMFNNVNAQDGAPGSAIAAGVLPDFSDVYCGANDRQYSVKATLYDGASYWCVDYTGASRKVAGTPTSGIVCP